MADIQLNNEVILVNLATQISASRKKQIKTVTTHFEAYLKSHVLTNIEFDGNGNVLQQVFENHREIFTQDIVGMFADYLARVAKIKSAGTMETYLSTLKGILEEKLDSDHTLFKSPFFRKLRRSVKIQYGKDGSAAKSAYPMTIDDLKVIVQVLLFKGDLKALMDRNLLCLQWQVMGRIGEVSCVKITGLKIVKNGNLQALGVELFRPKNSEVQSLLVFPNPVSFLICPLHALATWLAMYPASNYIFPDEYLPKAHYDKHTNNVIKEASDIARNEGKELSEKLTSHSMRAGSPTFVKSVANVLEQDIGRRGCWNIGRAKAMNRYLHYTEINDAKIGRILSEWSGPYLETGGQCIFFDSLHPEEGDKSINLFSTELFGATELKQPVQEALTMTLIIHYNELKGLSPHHPLIQKMEKFILNPEVLERWSSQVKQKFLSKNNFNTVGSLNESLPVLSSLQPILEGQQQLQHQSLNQQNQMNEISNSIHAILEYQKRLESMIQVLTSSGLSPTPAGILNNSSLPVNSNAPPLVWQPHYSPINKLPALKSMETKTLFEKWFTEELFKEDCRNTDDKETMETFKQVICFSKCLLPGDTVINPKPSAVNDLQPWLQQIRNLSGIVSEKWIELKRKYELNRKHEIKLCTVQSAKKLIPVIMREMANKPADQQIFKFPNIVDLATPQKMKWENSTHRNYSKKQRI